MGNDRAVDTHGEGARRTWEQYIQSSPQYLWKALTDAELTKKWYYRASLESDWQRGSGLVYRTSDGQIAAEGEILEIEPVRRLCLAIGSPPVRETWEIQSLETGCRVTVHHDQGARDLVALADSLVPQALLNLKAFLETGRIPPIQTITFDCIDARRLASFWAEVTGYEWQPYGEGEAALIDPHGLGPRLKFNQVPEPKAAKNRVHLDIAAAELQADIDRLISLGARQLWSLGTSVVFADPEGNEFCIF